MLGLKSWVLLGVLMCVPAYAAAQEEIQPETIESCGTSFLELPGSQPDALKWEAYGEVFHEYVGVSAYSNGGYQSSKCYQCTEVIPRFLKQVYGFEANYCGGYGNGNRTAEGIANAFSGVVSSSALIAPYQVRLQYIGNGTSNCRPTIGSIMSFELGKYGHVAIVRDLQENTDGTLAVTLFAQHGGMYNRVGTPISADTAVFEQDENGNWHGTYKAPTQKEYPVIGWTNPNVAGNSADPDDFVTADEPSSCLSISAEKLPHGQTICRAIAAAKSTN